MIHLFCDLSEHDSEFESIVKGKTSAIQTEDMGFSQRLNILPTPAFP